MTKMETLAATIGRKSFSSEKLLENYNHFIESVKKEKPDTIKGEFIREYFHNIYYGNFLQSWGSNSYDE